MDVISISDSNSRDALVGGDEKPVSLRHDLEITTISSLKSSEICTSKKSSLSLLNSKPFCSPSPKSKVTCWLSKNSMEDFSAPLEEAPLIVETDIYFHGFKEFAPTATAKNLIIVRQDYNKSISANSDVISVHSQNSIRSERPHETPSPVRIMQDLVKSMTNLCDQLPKEGEDLKNKKIIKTTPSAPMSPESQKKNELCEYLKLMNMNPVDQKIINMTQNRRSTRVKHLAIMSEKRELDKRLHKEFEDNEKKKKTSRRSSIASKASGRKLNGSVKSSAGSSETSKLAESVSCEDKRSTRSHKLNGSKLRVPNSTQRKPSRQSSPVESNEEQKSGLTFNSLVIPLVRISLTPVDFEDSIRDVLMEENALAKIKIPPKKVKQKSKKKANHKSIKSILLRWSTNSTKPKLRRKDMKIKRMFKNFVKSKPQKSNFTDSLTEKKKNLRKFKNNTVKSKLHNAVKNKLRSRGHLQCVEIKTLLRKGEEAAKIKQRKRKKKPKFVEKTQKKKLENKIESENSLVKIEEREVQPVESSSKNTDLSFSHKSIDLIFFEQNFTQINTELNYLHSLTPEHRKALFESKKFLDDVVEDDPIKVVEEKPTPSDVVPFLGFYNDMSSSQVVQESETSYENDPISSEDLEVQCLMNRTDLTSTPRQMETSSSSCSEHSKCTQSPTIPTPVPSTSKTISSPIPSTSKTIPSPIPSTSKTIPSPIPSTSKTEPEQVQSIAAAKPPSTSYGTEDQITDEEEEEEESESAGPIEPEVVNIAQIHPNKCKYVNPSAELEVKQLPLLLTQPPKKFKGKYRINSPNSQKYFDENFSAEKKSSQSYKIFLSNINGCVMSAFYLDYNLIVVQELLVSFWNQTPLGNVLGAQDMWMPKGNTSRIVLSSGCIPIESTEMAISVDNLVAYFELWVKEHKSDKRERPLADIFVAVYFRNRTGPDRKVLQLENIHSSSNDVQYIVLKNSPNIVVTWNVTDNDVSTTVLHCYQLSPDYQTVISIKKMQAISHYVSSLHNIQDCDTLIMGCGSGKITLCNIEFGYVVATIDLVKIIPQPRILWAQCDRGFLFTLHQFEDRSLHLIAINSFDLTWKKLQTYKPSAEFENLSGVCMENGILIAFYENGILCWSARTGDILQEDGVEETIFFPFGKDVIVVVNNQVHVRHALGYLMCDD